VLQQAQPGPLPATAAGKRSEHPHTTPRQPGMELQQDLLAPQEMKGKIWGCSPKNLLGTSSLSGGQESFGWTRVNHRPPLPSAAQPPAVPGAPAAALPRMESSADSLRPLSCPKPAKLFKHLNPSKRDGATSTRPGWAGTSWERGRGKHGGQRGMG